MNTIKITVEASTGGGKSCVAHAIADALRKQNLNCTVDDIDAEPADTLENCWGSRICQLAQKAPVVEIITKQSMRTAK